MHTPSYHTTGTQPPMCLHDNTLTDTRYRAIDHTRPSHFHNDD